MQQMQSASKRPTLIADIIDTPKSLPTATTIMVFPTIKSANDPIITGKFENRSF